MTRQDARTRVLGKIGAIYGRATPPPRAEVAAAYADIPRTYLRAHHGTADGEQADVVALFAERAADYRAIVERVTVAQLPDAVAAALRRRATAHPGAFVLPDGVSESWLTSCRHVASDAEPALTFLADTAEARLTPADLDTAAGVITGCATTIAETGTVILDHGPGQGRRALTLVPDFHLVVVLTEQVEPDLADAFARLDPRRPHTLMSGPSATSDIEFNRVEGVHGPRTLHILIAG